MMMSSDCQSSIDVGGTVVANRDRLGHRRIERNEEPDMSTTEANKELVRQEIAGLSANHSDVIDRLYADEIVVGMNRTRSDESVVTRDDVKALYEEWHEAFPDLTTEINEEVADGDVVVCHVTLRGTHEGAFRGIEPTGNGIEVDGFHFRRISEGKIVEVRSMVGMGTLLAQLGVELPFRT